jgi:hypothetical protein
MKRSLKVLVGLILAPLLVAECAVHAENKTDEAAVRNFPQAFAAAWAKHDGHQLAKTMSEDVGLRQRRWRLAAWEGGFQAISHSVAFRPLQRVDDHASLDRRPFPRAQPGSASLELEIPRRSE